jgi:hypothetical protein
VLARGLSANRRRLFEQSVLSDLCFAATNVPLTISSTATAMLSAVIRNGARRQTPNASRWFSSSTNKLAAAEVKKLGVIGAGQMVSFLRSY